MDQEEKVVRPSRSSFSISPKLIILIILVLFLVSGIMSSFFVVDQTEQAVVLRFGRYSRTVGPGLQTRIPFGIEKSYIVPTQIVQTLTFGYRSTDTTGTSLRGAMDYKTESTMLTGDLNIVEVEWIIQYKINNPRSWLFKVRDRITTLRDISQSVMNQLVGDMPILSIMTNQRTNIEIEAQRMMQEIFDRYDFGIQIITVKLQNIVPPAGDVQDAFEDVNKAIQDMNRYINEGKEYYNTEIPAAQGEASKLILQAQGYAAERVNEAEGDVARFNFMREAYHENKDITKTRLYIETMDQIFRDTNNTRIFDKNLTSVLPLYDVQGGSK